MMRDNLADLLREEAAAWFAAMRGPAAQERKAEFETWLASDPAHRSAYARIAEIYSMGKSLRIEIKPNAEKKRSRVSLKATVIACVGLMLISASWLAWKTISEGPGPQTERSVAEGMAQPGAFRSAIGEIQRIKLADGSLLTLDTDSVVSTEFTSSARSLRLVRGKARFEVAHEARPFSVTAGTMIVTAHGTVFDVSITPGGHYNVHLLRGSVDVRQPSGKSDRAHMVSQEILSPGQTVEADASGLRRPRSVSSSPPGDDWPSALRKFNGIKLGALVEEANRYSRTKIRTPAPNVADLSASGTFRINDTQRLAENLAILLDLRVRNEADGTISIVSQ